MAAQQNTHGLVLFAHGARDPEWALPIRRVEQAVRQAQPALPVCCAFLEFMTPDLSQGVDDLIAQGCQSITITPVFLAQGGHLKRDLPLLVAQQRERYPQVTFQLTTALGEDAGVVQALAQAALASLSA